MERVLKPDGKQFRKASRRYCVGVDGGVVGSMTRNSSSMFSPMSWRARSAPETVAGRWRGRESLVMLLCSECFVKVKSVGKRFGRYVEVSQT